MRIVVGCLRPTPTDYLPTLTGIYPVELQRQGTTLALENHCVMDPNHLLHQLMVWSTPVQAERLRSQYPFELVARKLLSELSEMSIHAAK